jgi:hypothetical protein
MRSYVLQVEGSQCGAEGVGGVEESKGAGNSMDSRTGGQVEEAMPIFRIDALGE